MRRSILLCLPLLAACGEETPEPKPPKIVAASTVAKCRKVGAASEYVLHEITVTVEDGDGADDLEAAGARMIVLASILKPSATLQDDLDRVVFKWTSSPDDEPIYCGTDGKLLKVEFEVRDADGFPARAVVSTSAL